MAGTIQVMANDILVFQLQVIILESVRVSLSLSLLEIIHTAEVHFVIFLPVSWISSPYFPDHILLLLTDS